MTFQLRQTDTYLAHALSNHLHDAMWTRQELGMGCMHIMHIGKGHDSIRCHVIHGRWRDTTHSHTATHAP